MSFRKSGRVSEIKGWGWSNQSLSLDLGLGSGVAVGGERLLSQILLTSHALVPLLTLLLLITPLKYTATPP